MGSPSLLKQRYERNIDNNVNKQELWENIKVLQDQLRGEDLPFRQSKVNKASLFVSDAIDLMVIKFVYKPKAGNGYYLGYTNHLEEILNEARMQCLTAIFKFKYDYKKSKEVFCYLTYTIQNACNQIMNGKKRQTDIKYKFVTEKIDDDFSMNDYGKLNNIQNANDFSTYLDRCINLVGIGNDSSESSFD